MKHFQEGSVIAEHPVFNLFLKCVNLSEIKYYEFTG